MARISKYKNAQTDVSVRLLEITHIEALEMTLGEIEVKQMRYGISDAQLSDFLNIDKAVMSTFKKNGKLPKYYIKSIYFLFKYLERELK
jgi:hypothetical protein